MTDYLRAGKIVKTIGLKGEVKVYPTTHFRDSRFKIGNHVFLYDEKSDTRREITIKKHSKNGNCDNLIFNEFSSLEEVQKIIGQYLEVVKDRSFLKKHQYFYSDLIGLHVVFDSGESIGTVIAVEEFTNRQTLRIKTSGSDAFVPFIDVFISSVDLDKKEIVVKYIKGLV